MGQAGPDGGPALIPWDGVGDGVGAASLGADLGLV
jgi:hypothetical protein